MSMPQTPVEVFCSFAPTDAHWQRKLETHLSLMQRQGLITSWQNRQITAGTDRAKAIDEHLKATSIILLLISSDFLASDYCYGTELQQALERHEAGEARVIPILLRPVADWKSAPFAQLVALPTTAEPITKWRNKDEAFADVAAGIRRAIEELGHLSVKATASSDSRIWNVPYPRNPFFLGREDLLDQLATELRKGETMALSQPQAISGLGGVGKTQLAVEYAYRHQTDYSAVLWARADSREALISFFVTLAEQLNVSGRDPHDATRTVQAVTAWLQRTTGWLLILDNADELNMVREFLPPTNGGHLLLTTRAQAMGRLAHKLEVDTFTPELGALFLLRRATLLAPDAPLEQATPQERELALQLTHDLGGLPLAIDQAGAYLEETGCSLADYQQLYRHHRTALLNERRGQVPDHPEPVATTWSLAFQRLEQTQPAAVDLLRLCAFLAPDAIPEELITEGASHLGERLSAVAADSLLLNQAIEALRAYSLMRRDPGNRTLSIHRLVQAILQDTMDEPTYILWTERTVQAVAAAFPQVEHATWPQCKRLLVQALACEELVRQGKTTQLEAHYCSPEPRAIFLSRLAIRKPNSWSGKPSPSANSSWDLSTSTLF